MYHNNNHNNSRCNVFHLHTVDGSHTRVLDKDLMVRDCHSYLPVGI
ncbi:hypothetical protein NC652_041205 [Populus alba x Populus x berolinensis]|nr:hypothetical protein NC652_041205 [Populus alba x Populus x berolinensis]